MILGNSVTEIADIFSVNSFGLSTDLILAIQTFNQTYEFYDIYRTILEPKGEFHVSFAGNWNSNDRIDIYFTQDKITRRSDQNGLNLRAFFFKVCLMRVCNNWV